MNIARLSDPDDPRLADYRELRDASARRRIEGDEFFIAEGPVAIERLLASHHRVRSLLVAEARVERMQGLLAQHADAAEIDVFVVDPGVLQEIVGFNLHRGVIAAADRLPNPMLADITLTARRIAVLEGLNDPENLGAIARSARALSIDALVLDPTCIDPYTRRSVRVSMGEVLHLPTCRIDRSAWPAAIDDLHAAGFVSWAMTPAPDSVDVWSLPVTERLAIMLGAEGPGLSRRAMTVATHRVRLPIHDDVDSLNVGAAAAVTFAIANRPEAT